MKTEKPFNKIFGKKYYAVIVTTGQVDNISGTIFETKKDVEAFRQRLKNNRCPVYLTTVTFRSREPLVCRLPQFKQL